MDESFFLLVYIYQNFLTGVESLQRMKNIQESHFNCFDLASRLTQTNDDEDWIVFPHILTGHKACKARSEKSELLRRSEPLASQDDCINKSLHPRLFPDRFEGGKAARRATYNFQVGLTNVVDTCRRMKSAKCLPTQYIESVHRSNINGTDADGSHENDMWYFHP